MTETLTVYLIDEAEACFEDFEQARKIARVYGPSCEIQEITFYRKEEIDGNS